jgi:hypothetical protein
MELDIIEQFAFDLDDLHNQYESGKIEYKDATKALHDLCKWYINKTETEK